MDKARQLGSGRSCLRNKNKVDPLYSPRQERQQKSKARFTWLLHCHICHHCLTLLSLWLSTDNGGVGIGGMTRMAAMAMVMAIGGLS